VVEVVYTPCQPAASGSVEIHLQDLQSVSALGSALGSASDVMLFGEKEKAGFLQRTLQG